MRKRLQTSMAAGAVLIVLATACTKSSSTGPQASGGSTGATDSSASASGYHPALNPANFTGVVDNPWFPLQPGSTRVYEGSKDGKPVREVYVVTSGVQRVNGVPCAVIHDQLFSKTNGSLVEDTFDFYTQDVHGNVWYFGEMTVALDPQGRMTDTSGSWLAGENGAQPGIFMEAGPVVGHQFRQEYYPGQAEDTFKVLDLSAGVTVPYGSFNDSLLTQETTVLEPGIVDHKNYVKGIGEVAELQVKGPQPPEQLHLVSYTQG